MEDLLRSLAIRLREIFPARRRLLLAGSLLTAVFLLFLLAVNQNVSPEHPKTVPYPAYPGNPNTEVALPDANRIMGVDTKETSAAMSARIPAKTYSGGAVDSAGFLPEPRIAYSAELSVVTKEFAHSRSNLEEILERHRGYVAKLRLVGQPSGSVLSATLRVPSSEYRSALTELKAVGFVEHEEEAADEITQHHGELEARLINAQNEEQRIQRLLQNQPQKLYDSSSLERQVAMLHAEMERIESERSAASSQVAFANVSFSLREERTTPAETVGAKLRNAAVGGLSDAFESISTLLLFLAARGPLLALWAVLIYLPARFFWRRRSQWGFREAEAPKHS
jgi:uncharacterized small protein (DUF1192 family)